MKTRLALAGAALFAFSGVANAATTPMQPLAGTYLMTINDVSQTGAACGGGADGGSGGTSPGTFRYSGAAAMGTALTQVKNDSGDYGFTIVNFPKTPAAGVKAWSGSFSAIQQPSGKSLSGTFKSTFTFVDSGHFLLTLTIVQGGCSQLKHIAAYSTSSGLTAAAVERR
jgi:hypothetical protein